MTFNEILFEYRKWLDELIASKAPIAYVNDDKKTFTLTVNSKDNKSILALPADGSKPIKMTYEKIEDLLTGMWNAKDQRIHVDTYWRGNGSHRSVYEAIVASFPVVGYMPHTTGRNHLGNKVIEIFPKEIHNLGEKMDVSDAEYSEQTFTGNVTAHEVIGLPISKPFVLLAGISGTGKSRFVRKQAESWWKTKEEISNPRNFELISVRPDWHEPSDLLGYVTRLGNDGPQYVATDVLKFIVKAWKEISPTEEQLTEGKFINKQTAPFWLCLDEMNLAPVEQYFADYLSVLETRKWEDGKYSCEPILKPGVFLELTTVQGASDNSKNELALDKLRKDLALDNKEFNSLWKYFSEKGIPLPYNLIVAGTVNMDETTHGFSRKVIDRALTFDFGEFFPNDYSVFLDKDKQPNHIQLSYPTISSISNSNDMNYGKIIDSDGSKTIAFMTSLNTVLKGSLFELAYRALNESLVMVRCFTPEDEPQLHAVWDDFLMTKVLPRIEGDDEKLAYIPNDKGASTNGMNLLKKLEEVLSGERMLEKIWQDKNKSRPDFLTDNSDLIPCRSQAKLKWMQEKLERTGFTSFWP